MNKIFSIISVAVCVQTISFGQIEKEIGSSVKKVTVYAQGAQIEREANFSIQQGQMILKLTKLSPYIKKESIRIDGDGTFTILNVQHQNDFLNELDKNKEIESIKDKIEALQLKVEDEQTWININREKLDFLSANKVITGKEQTVNPEIFESLNTIYGNNIETLNLDVLKKQRLINEYNKELNKLNNQLISLNSKSDLPSGTILVSIDSKQTKTAKLIFNYLIDNAAWYPSYDIRFLGTEKPLMVTYRAHIRQNTGIDWKDVDLVLSTAKTDISAQIPTLSPFYLQFYYPEISMALQGVAAGVQYSETSAPPSSESAIRIKGTSSIAVKDEPYGISTITSKRETSNEYIVDAPQTVVSNNRTTDVNFRETELGANFEYQSVPKLSENVFLIGKISDWYKAELIDGEVNLYLENSYVGKSSINTQQFKDTLEISFGIDNNISIKRERLTEYSENQFIGPNRTETFAYKLTLRNNKTYAITSKIVDQIPVSGTKDIQVEILELSGGKMNTDSGKVEWEIELKPNETKELIIKFSVKYPKDKKVIID